MSNRIRYLLLLALSQMTRWFYRHERIWLHDEPEPPWRDLKMIVFLNHTSLFEWLFLGAAPRHLLRRIAYQAVIPAADVTLARPIIGRFLRMLAPHVVAISRQKDHTWNEVLRRVSPECFIVIAPEGRMMRANGLDKHGRRMTVRGGIADILQALPGGRMLLVYSGGLHHVQVPGQGFPRLFKTLRVALEMVDIAAYKASVEAEAKAERAGFKRAVIDDLERRRDLNCPPLAADGVPSPQTP